MVGCRKQEDGILDNHNRAGLNLIQDVKCLALSGRKLNQLSVCCCADVFLPCPDNLLVNLHECRDMVIELLNQLPGLFEGNHETGNALGTALQAAFKLMVGQSYSLSFCVSLRSFAHVVLVFFLGSWFLFLCVCLWCVSVLVIPQTIFSRAKLCQAPKFACMCVSFYL